jgi:rubredoxin
MDKLDEKFARTGAQGQDPQRRKLPSHLDKKLPNTWHCRECKSLLGVLDEKKEMVRMKYKDFYVYFKGGEVTVPCRSCGFINVAKSTDNVTTPFVLPEGAREVTKTEQV